MIFLHPSDEEDAGKKIANQKREREVEGNKDDEEETSPKSAFFFPFCFAFLLNCVLNWAPKSWL